MAHMRVHTRLPFSEPIYVAANLGGFYFFIFDVYRRMIAL